MIVNITTIEGKRHTYPAVDYESFKRDDNGIQFVVKGPEDNTSHVTFYSYNYIRSYNLVVTNVKLEKDEKLTSSQDFVKKWLAGDIGLGIDVDSPEVQKVYEDLQFLDFLLSRLTPNDYEHFRSEFENRFNNGRGE